MLNHLTRKILLINLALYSALAMPAQNSYNKDSLENITSKIQRLLQIDLDSSKYWILQRESITERERLSTNHAITFRLYGEYFNRLGNADSSFHYFEQSQNILLEVGDSVNYARNSIGLGRAYARMGKNDKALEVFKNGLTVFEGLKDSLGVAIVNDNVGTNFSNWGQYNEALQYLFTANTYYRKLGFKVFEGNTFNTIALIYRRTQNRELEVSYLKKAFAILTEQNDSIKLGLVTVNLGETYIIMDFLDKGFPYLKKAESLFKSAGYQYGLLSTYNAYVVYYQKEETRNDTEAEKYGTRSKDLALKINAHQELADAAFNLGVFYESNKMNAKAIKAFELANETASRYNFPRVESSSAKHLAALFEDFGNTKIALKYLKVYQTTKDSLLNKEQIEEFKEIELGYEFAQERLSDSLAMLKEKQVTAQIHQNEIVKEQQSKYLLLFGLLLIGIIAGFSILAYKRQQKQAVILSEKNTEIEKALHEKQLLLKEVHHRVKNNFQIISSLLELQSKGIEDEKAKELAQEGKNRVKSMALIHQKLYQNDDLLIYFDDYISKLVNEISSMYGKGITTKVSFNVPKLAFDIDTAIPLGLIVNELVTNAFKYGGGEEENNIQISLIELKQGNYSLEVSNTGQAIPENFDISKAKSLGLRLVRSLSKQLHGTVSFLSDKETTFKVLFKDTVTRALTD